MIAKPPVIESFSRVAPLGIRFWDEITRTTIDDGLMVSAYRTTQPERRYTLSSNRAQIFTMQNVLGPIEFGAGDQAYWDELPPLQNWVIEVIDLGGRFIPFSFTAFLPQRGLFQLPCSSPLEPTGFVPLFSAVTRSVPGFGLIQADLLDETRFNVLTSRWAPASGALVEAWYEGNRIGRGLADPEGRIAILFPYPEPIDQPFTSPYGQRIRLTEQRWTVELQAFYSPILSPLTPASPLPDLCEGLRQSRAILLSTLSPPTPLSQISVKYGVPEPLKTSGQSEMLIRS